MNPLLQLHPITLAEFAARAAVHSATGAGISGLVADSDDLDDLAPELASELEFIADRPTALVRVKEDPQLLLTAIDEAGDAAVVLFGFAALGQDTWAQLDRLRNLLQPPAGLILLMTPSDIEHLQECAPNLSSWLGGRVWRWSDETFNLSDAEVQQRLATLRAAFGKTDDEVIAAARDGTLPLDPEYADWLILLGHGDLLS